MEKPPVEKVMEIPTRTPGSGFMVLMAVSSVVCALVAVYACADAISILRASHSMVQGQADAQCRGVMTMVGAAIFAAVSFTSARSFLRRA